MIVFTIPVVGMITLILLLNVFSPSSSNVLVVRNSIGIVSQVKGRVVEVPVKINQQVKKGDVLFDTWDEPMAVTGWREPHKPSSTGRIFLQDVDTDPNDHFSIREYFPSVVGCKFIEETENE